MFKCNSWVNTVFVFKLGLFFSAIALSANAADDGPEVGEPIYQLVDSNYINLAGGQINYSLNDLSIGHGALALTHHISINASDALNWDAVFPGYKEKYQGAIRRTEYSRETVPDWPWGLRENYEVTTVTDDIGTTQFEVNDSGQFEAMKNKNVTLKIVGSNFELTREDGTVVIFKRTSPNPSVLTPEYNARGYMTQIKYTNGHTITIHREAGADSIGSIGSTPIKSVTSNNGLQLKYIYDRHSRPLEASKRSSTNRPSMPADSNNWSYYHPSKIIALNNAVETCPILGNTCETQHEWPEVNYHWPDGMPRAFYIGSSLFSVTDATGRVTEFHHKALSPNGDIEDVTDGEATFPRIVRIKSNTGEEVGYKYKNTFALIPSGMSVWYAPTEQGVIIKALKNGRSTSYNVGTLMHLYGRPGTGDMQAFGGAYKSINSVRTKTTSTSPFGKKFTVPYLIESWNKKVHLSQDIINKVERIEDKLNQTTTEYHYDTYGRLVGVDGVNSQTIAYQYRYNGQCSSYKTCNKPTAISDRYGYGSTGRYTFYTYHNQSGQVQSIKNPKNRSGLIAEIKNIYQQYYATYINSAGVLANANEPIWLLSSSSTCKNSNMLNGNCSSNDKVTTTYEYGTGGAGNNLFLLGTTLTTQGEPTVRRTCFKYDKYGNQIEISQPKSNISSCNIGREYE
ncbi:hypothetical protein [Shewanella woodyi]|uniref:YD repeat protein n=1 Tax=Shewanella woodyi (strain ATCC 51908 / MS32) TaxID=392500 RepID=B1KJF0_SHEWM|nr:hypothetical protein [Shewanella woodyi]ACA88622.1 hypothetical protein Swoo_4369 [Shewanella woodyi ATCC 51908]